MGPLIITPCIYDSLNASTQPLGSHSRSRRNIQLPPVLSSQPSHRSIISQRYQRHKLSDVGMHDMEDIPTISDLEYDDSDDYYNDSDDSDDSGITHIYLRSKCDLCFQFMDYKQSIAILGNSSSTHPVYCTKLFPFPDRRGTTRYQEDEVPLCRKSNCGPCFDSAEAVTMHSYCYRLFLQSHRQDNALNSAWVSSEWRYPWRPSPATHYELDLEDRSIISVSPSRAKALGMPKLASLPPTILQDIKASSIESPFWHYSAIRDLAERMSSAAVENSCKVHHLDTIEAWDRGESLVITKSASKSVVVRVTIDCRGIRKIERLRGWPQYRNWRSNSLAYVFIELAQAKKSRLGSARLDLEQGGFEWPRRWDTPTPPTGLSMFALPTGGFDLRLRTVDLRDTTGLTFFFIRGSIHGIHSHTASSPTAFATYERFPERIRSRLVWAYVPVPRNDRILSFGIRESGILIDIARATFSKPTVLIRTKLAGDIILGSRHRITNRDCIFDGTPDVLVYSAPDPMGEAAFGATAAKT
ncbi:hypothetical protein FSARC_2182 [Fusarium sarcochroum]|uniref:Uncharacterized protein n=1 Tax=Fusarium sarcochroum TaxID=1208366 RepID=A0A8H4U714_9HYPO|nr:hypothetical protein FSARC_2182 [Fusarium sarcochroum]